MKSDVLNEALTIGIDNGLLISDLSVLEQIQRMQDVFSDATGVASVITYPDGTPLTKPSNFCRLCEMVRSTEKGLANCIESDKLIAQNISSELKMNSCLSAGLWDTGAKIMVDDNHLANWMIGQVRNKNADFQKIKDYAEVIGIDKTEFEQALNEVPVMSSEQFQKVSNMLSLFVNEFIEKMYTNNQLKQQNLLLHQSQELLSITLNSIGDGVISTDKEGFIVEMNPIAENLTGWKLKNAKGKPLTEIFKIINSHTRKDVENPVQKVISSGKIIGLANHTVLISEDGNEYQIADSAAPIKNKEGEICGVVLVFSDITEKYKAEHDLEASERYLKETQTIAQLGTYTTDIVNGHWISSEVLDSIFGIEKNHDKSVTGWVSIIHPDWQTQMNNYFVNEVIAKKKRFDKEYKIVRKSDNIERWVHGLGELHFDKSGNPVTMIGTIQDITERKESEEKLRKSEEKYRNIFDNVHDVFYKIDLAGNILEVSPSALYYKDFIELNESSNILDLSADTYNRKYFIESLMKTGEIRDYELDLRGKTGEIRHASINAKLIRDIAGKPMHIIGALRDINKRKKAEIALRESEQFLKETQKIAMIGNWSVNFNTGTWKCSEILDQILGIDSGVNKDTKLFSEVLHPDWIEEVNEYFLNDVLPNKIPFNKKFQIIRKNDKDVRWIHGIGELKIDENILFGTVQDITERKVAAEALRKSQEELKKFAAHLQNVREEERNMLAREIHDDLGQILIAMKIDMGMLKNSVFKIAENEKSDLKTQFDNLQIMIDNTLKSARRIMTDLRPEVLDMLGFTDTVKQHLSNFQQRYNIDCKFKNNASNLRLDSQQSVALFRIVQEALNNIAKHSKATKVDVKLNIKNNKLTLEIIDNGVGFDQNDKKNNDSYGLMGMKERIYLLEGELIINSKKDMGTIVKVIMPYSQN